MSGVQKSEWTLNNVAPQILLSYAEFILSHCWGKKEPVFILLEDILAVK